VRAVAAVVVSQHPEGLTDAFRLRRGAPQRLMQREGNVLYVKVVRRLTVRGLAAAVDVGGELRR
tara:strand:- start:528 stop:719 length:192 start_codon:yes stop_codon:yes gene_type:complete